MSTQSSFWMFLAGGCASMCLAGSVAAAPRILLQPISSSGPGAVVVGNEITIPVGGVDITLELRGVDWHMAPGAPQLNAIQATLDSSGYLGANANPPNVGVNLTPKGYALPDPNGGNRPLGAFMTGITCSGGSNPGTDCSSNSFACTGGGTCVANPPFVFSCCGTFGGINTTALGYLYGATTANSGSVASTGNPALGYFGTLILSVPPGAGGSYTINYLPSPDSFMFSGSFVEIPGVVFSPAVITIGIPAQTPGSEPIPVPKNRYVTFAPNNGALPVSFQVRHAASGKMKWVAAPTAGVEALNLVARLTGDGTLGTIPALRVWTEPVIHATDCMIVPVNGYEVRTFTSGIGFTAPLTVNTIAQPGAKFWADTNGPIVSGAFSAPNGLVDFIDINAAVQRFQNTATAPPLTWVDLEPQSVNVLLNFADINRIVQGFQGQTYPFLAPVACP